MPASHCRRPSSPLQRAGAAVCVLRIPACRFVIRSTSLKIFPSLTRYVQGRHLGRHVSRVDAWHVLFVGHEPPAVCGWQWSDAGRAADDPGASSVLARAELYVTSGTREQSWPFLDRCHPAAGEAAGPGGAPAAQRGRTTWGRGETTATIGHEEGPRPRSTGQDTAPEGHLTPGEEGQRKPLTQRGIRYGVVTCQPAGVGSAPQIGFLRAGVACAAPHVRRET